MDPTKFRLRVELVDAWGEVHGAISYELPEEAAFQGETAANDFRFNASIGAFAKMADAVQILKVRKFRRDLLTECAKQAGEQLASHLEDREGWHGGDRQAKVEAAFKRHR